MFQTYYFEHNIIFIVYSRYIQNKIIQKLIVGIFI